MTLMANVFPKLRPSRNAVREIFKKYPFRITLEKQHGKRAPTLLKSQRRHVYQIYWSLWSQLSLKKSLLVKCKTLRLFVNTFTAHDKYSALKGQYLQDPIHLKLSQKQKIFSSFFSAFLNSRFNFQHIKKKMTLIANVFPKFRTSENLVR